MTEIPRVEWTEILIYCRILLTLASIVFMIRHIKVGIKIKVYEWIILFICTPGWTMIAAVYCIVKGIRNNEKSD